MTMQARAKPALAPKFFQSPEGGTTDAAPAVDLVHLSRQTLGDRELETELLTLFARQAGTVPAALDGARTCSDMGSQKAADLLHMLCGSARAVGCWDVAAQAQHLERTLRAEGWATSAETALAALAARIDRACTAIAELLGERG